MFLLLHILSHINLHIFGTHISCKLICCILRELLEKHLTISTRTEILDRRVIGRRVCMTGRRAINQRTGVQLFLDQEPRRYTEGKFDK